MTPTFLGLSDPCCTPEKAAVRILPVPYEGTVTYGKGAAGGPRAALEASAQVELYDEALRAEPWRRGIATLPALRARKTPARMVQAVEREVARHVAPGRCVVTLGGEHSISSGAVAAHLAACPGLGVVQFDAHADLRDRYAGSPWNHACVMARIRERVPAARVLQLGIRSLSGEEAALAGRKRYRLVSARDLIEKRVRLADRLRRLPRHIYVTFDVDVFDPAVIRATGTPEPGGLDWYTVMDLLETLFVAKQVIGFDVVELSGGDPTSAFAAARLLYRMIGLWQR